MIESILISIFISFLMGYDPSVILSHIEILIPMILIVAMFPAGLIIAFKKKEFMIKYRGCFGLILQALFLVPIIINYKSLNIFSVASVVVFMFIGRMMNKIVIKANDGCMPVFPLLSRVFFGDKVKDMMNKPGYVEGYSETRYKILSDWIDLGYEIYSPGDLISFIPFGILIFNLIAFLTKII